MAYLQKRDKQINHGGDSSFDAASCPVLKSRPALGEFLTMVRWDDDSPRVPGTILVFAEGACLKACLSDRDAGLVAFVSSESLHGLLTACEEGLKDDSLDWRTAKNKKK